MEYDKKIHSKYLVYMDNSQFSIKKKVYMGNNKYES